MTDDTDPGDLVQQRIDAIEEAYEFMLAYAAQGRRSDSGSSAGTSIRAYLERAEEALDHVAADAKAAIENGTFKGADALNDFVEILDHDAQRARAAIRLVLALPGISSQMIDNLNASIHLRTVLTDLFLIDEALKPSKLPNTKER